MEEMIVEEKESEEYKTIRIKKNVYDVIAKAGEIVRFSLKVAVVYMFLKYVLGV